MRVNPALLAFNRGLVSPLGLARIDMERLRLSAEEQTNWIPRTLGSMMLRPGLEYLGSTLNDRRSISMPFLFEANDLARIELTDGWMRIWIDDAPITRPAVAARVVNGDFSDGLVGWTSSDETGAESSWSSGRMSLRGTGASAAKRWIQTLVASGQAGLEHALRVVVAEGPVTLKVGSAPGADDMLGETTLTSGEHSLAFAPNAGAFTIMVSHRGEHTALLESIQVEGAGDLALPMPYGEADISNVRWAQSRDVVFLASDGVHPLRLERRGRRSWSVVRYQTADGPFLDENLSRATLAPSALTGDVTLTASAEVFRPGHAGALFRLASSGQRISRTINAEDVFTAPGVRITGVEKDRQFTISVSSTGSTVTLQRAIGADEPLIYEDVQTFPSNSSDTFDDESDNQIIYYRLGVKTGDFVDPVEVSISYPRGSIDGIARVTAVTSPTSAKATVLRAFGATDPTSFWAEGSWSDVQGWPTAVALFEGRLWWGGRGKLWGSASDAFASFDAEIEGGSGPIDKTISDGPSDVVAWIAAGERMVLGALGGAFEAFSSSLNEPLTPSACALRRFSTTGCANVPAMSVDGRVHFVQRAAREMLEARSIDSGGRQAALRLSAHAPEIGGSGFVRLAVQHQPDIRVHCVRADGTAAVLVTDPAEEVRCWVEVETDGEIEDVSVLPNGVEDAVYYTVKRLVDGKPRRFHERWALEEDCRGGPLNRQADSFVIYDGAPTSVISGLEHLEGREVVAWADGTARANAVVSNGAITLSGAPAAQAVVGLPYSARFRSVKLAYGGRKGAALAQPKRINRLSLVLADVHAKGVLYGADFDRMDPLPPLQTYGPRDADAVYRSYDLDGAPFPGAWSTDARVCLQASAPRPCTVLGVTLDMETVER